MIRRCTADDFDRILAIINDAARAYRGVIPDDRWKEPYMPAGELVEELGGRHQLRRIRDQRGRTDRGNGHPARRGCDADPPCLCGDGAPEVGHRVGAARRIAGASGTVRFSSAPGLPPAGRLGSIAGMGSRRFRNRRKQDCCGATGPFLSARSRPPWSWPTPVGAAGCMEPAKRERGIEKRTGAP